jgi:hypothetical protein
MPIAKHAFLAALECGTKGWRVLRESSAPRSPGDEWRFHEGQQVQRLARAWIGAGVMLPGGRTQHALEATARVLADSANSLLFEATFEADGCIARADALRRTTDGWELIEIKSGSYSDSKKVKKEYLDDVAYTTAVAVAAGVPVTRVSLVLVNADYVEGSGAELITAVDVTAEALDRAAVLRDNLADVALVLEGEAPAAELCFSCRNCEYYGTSCVDIGITDPLFDIPRISEKKFDELRPFGRITNLPLEVSLTEIQTGIVAVIRSGIPAVDRAVLAQLDALTPPIYYLDFEAIAPAVPVFAGTKPYQKHPFQYSLHIIAADRAMVHVDYLADPTTDWRRALTERLLDDLGDHGPIVVYSSYEDQCLKQLAAWFPDLAPRIDAALARIFDLEKVVKGYIHPGFRGRTSIKKVLPVMSPDLSYDGMHVAGGEDAAAVFGFMWLGVYPPEEHERHRNALLAYCHLDTLAMVRVHEGLEAVRKA